MTLIEISNDFHHTSSRVRVGRMSESNAKRVRNRLCGSAECCCSQSELGTRGPQRTEDGQEIVIEFAGYGVGVDIWLRKPDVMCSDSELAERAAVELS